MANQSGETVLCTYRVRAEDENAFRSLLAEHWPTLYRLGFVTDDAAVVYRSADDPPTYVEIFGWREGGFGRGHEHPDVLDIWSRMEPLLEERGGQPRWSFPHYRVVDL